METVVQIAAVCLAAAILGAVLRQHSPETAAVLGLAVCAGQGAMAAVLDTAGAFGAVLVSLPLVRAAWELLRTLV